MIVLVANDLGACLLSLILKELGCGRDRSVEMARRRVRRHLSLQRLGQGP